MLGQERLGRKLGRARFGCLHDARISAKSAYSWYSFRLGSRLHPVVPAGYRHSHCDLGSLVTPPDLGFPDQLMAYTAHMALRRLDWTIRHHSAGDVARLLGFIARYRSLDLTY